MNLRQCPVPTGISTEPFLASNAQSCVVPSEEYTLEVARLSMYKCVPGAVWAEC